MVPSREGVPEYQALKATLDQLVGEINGEFSMAGWVPVHYHYKSLSPRDLLSLYRMARICFVTSIKDSGSGRAVSGHPDGGKLFAIEGLAARGIAEARFGQSARENNKTEAA